jgi:hypothetical protein
MRKPARLAVSLGAVAAAATALAGAAQALPASASTVQARTAAVPHVVKVTVPMKIAGFDAAVAQAHGYVIRTDARGRQYSVQAGAAAAASPAAVTPDNAIGGNCGSSHLYEYAVGNHAVDIQTGFNVNTPAVAYWWKYWMRDPGGTSSHTFGGGLARRTSWADDSRWGALTPGPASAWVDTGSDALLENGDVCTSAGPSSSATIY